jgi:cysteinyl-tRNA synthetase
MSKSLGNFITIRDLLDRPVDPMAVRLFVLMAQYRKPIDFTDEAIEAATNGWKTLKVGLLFGNDNFSKLSKLGWGSINTSCNREELDLGTVERFQTAMDDDFNSPTALTLLFELAKELRREQNLLNHEERTDAAPQTLERQWRTLVCLAQVLGLEARPEPVTLTRQTTMLFKPASSVTVSQINILSDAEIEAMIQQRADARKQKDFEMSDRIRNELSAQGITLIDKPGGVTHWHRN